MVEREKRPETCGPLYVVVVDRAGAVLREGHALVTVAEYSDANGVDVVMMVPAGDDRVVSVRMTTKQAYTLAMGMMRVRAQATRTLKRSSN